MKRSASTTVASRIDRLLSLIPFLASNPGVTLGELSKRLGVPRAVVLEELGAIMMCGVPPYGVCDYVAVHVEGDRVRLQFADHFERPVRWTLPEALALAVALEVLPIGRRGPFAREANRLAARIAAALPGGQGGPIRDLGERTGSPREPGEVLSAVRQALEERRQLRLDYVSASRDERRTRDVSPHALFEERGEWYLAAHCHARDEPRFFRIDRIRSARLADTHAVPSGDPRNLRRRFDEWRRRPSHRVRIRFDARAAPYVREAFGPGSVHPAGDGEEGAVELELECRGVDWLVPWLLPFGDGANVLEPSDLREALAAACRAILARYPGAPD